MRMKIFIVFALICFFLSPAFCQTSDWPQWRGPNFNGTSNQTGLPNTLDTNTMVWKSPLPGPGEATPAIVDGRIYLSGYNKTDKTLFAMCLDAESGKPLWQQTAATFEKLPRRNVIASPSPAADKNSVSFLYSEGTLVGYDSKGQQLWKRNLVKEYGPFKLGWSYSSSPVLYEGRLYIAVMRNAEPEKGSDYTGSLTPYLLCIDPMTGKNIFKTDRPTDATNDATDSYTTPIPTEINGQKQIVLYGGNYLTGHDSKTGHEIWRYNYMDEDMQWRRAAAMPIIQKDVIYCPFPMGVKLFACKLTEMIGGAGSHLWDYDQQACDIPSPVLVEGYLYLIRDNAKKLICLDATTGAEQWVGQLAKSDTYYASLTAADGKLYMVNRKGAVTVVAVDPKEFRILGNSVFDENPVDSTIVIAKGRVFLRTAENLYCFANQMK